MITDRISICTTCMNRNWFLYQALPTWVSCGFDDITIVDWSSEVPVSSSVEVIRIDGKSAFLPNEARNIGATHCKRDFILFIDCDIKINSLEGISLDENIFYNGCTSSVYTCGTCLVSKSAYQKVNGYDETFGVKSCEDLNFYYRLKREELELKRFPENSLTHIDHSFVSRVLYRPYMSIKQAEEYDKHSNGYSK